MKNCFSGKAKWIGSGEGLYDTEGLFPALQLRKTFFLENTVKEAECLICGLGLYVLYINGKRVGDDVLSPAFTAYDKRALFVRYDVTEYLKSGENVIAVKLGNGHYNQPTIDTWHFYHATWRNTPRLLFELFVDGKSAIVSDGGWTYSLDGATVHNALRTGEYYDARKEDEWREVGYDDNAWGVVKFVRPVGGKLEEQLLPPIRECDTLRAVDVWKSANGWVFDFGKNIAGYAGIKLCGTAGDTVRIRYAEIIEGKEIEQYNIAPYIYNGVFSEDRYTFRGAGVEEWKPDFVYHGFRYVELIGLTDEPTKENVIAYHVHTDLKEYGYFRCSDDMLNWLYETARLSFMNNFHGYPEDCPHREKNGWTGDAACSAEYSLFLFDMERAYYKWLKDVCDTQRESGEISCIAPTSAWGYNWGNGPAWDYALFHIPYAVYKNGGGTACMELVYPHLKKYVNFAENFLSEDGTLVAFGLGDWCPPRYVEDKRLVSEDFSDSCHFYSMLRILSETAKILGYNDESAVYAEKAEALRQAILARYVDGDHVEKDGQTALAMAVRFGIVCGEQAAGIARRLAETIVNDGYTIKFGILGAKAVYNVLAEYGYADVAYKLVSGEEYPSYGYWKKLGATTFWERWEESTREILASYDHHMYGSVTEFLVKGIAGLENTGVGYNTCRIKPYFFAENCSCACGTHTSFGEISVEWTKTGNEFVAVFRIPEGVNATLVLPKQEIKVHTGKMKFVIE